ncbi:MAG: hypothetical protein OEZ22_08120 [Spirochaetia bacterium]|nr:hypothetical protein [Spirochaetia bacterium]
MRCKKSPPWIKAKIKNIWEVHIDLSTWKNIKLAANMHNKSYSWIVRYCVFRLTNKKNLIMTNTIKKKNELLKRLKNNKKHRHLLCLYGDDELLLRNSALLLGISVSQLIRISITMFLGKILNKKVSKEDLFWYGIKIFAKIKIFRSDKRNSIVMEFHNYKKFLIENYWGFQ